MQTLSAFTKQPAPPPAPAIEWPPFEKKLVMEEQPFEYLNFLLQFCPEVPEEAALRARFAKIGIEPGKPFDVSPESVWTKAELKLAVIEGYEAIEKKRAAIGTTVNGWQHAGHRGEPRRLRGRLGAARGGRAGRHLRQRFGRGDVSHAVDRQRRQEAGRHHGPLHADLPGRAASAGRMRSGR